MMSQVIVPSISFVRVLSLLLVVVTHFLSWKGVCSFQINTVVIFSFGFALDKAFQYVNVFWLREKNV